jgi:hypothetical protein
MKRRGFLKRMFGGDDTVTRALYAVQVVVREHAMPDLRRKLHDAIQGHMSPEAAPTPAERRLTYKKLSLLLSKASPFVDYGFWEYETREKHAVPGFYEWLRDLESGMEAWGDVVEEDDESERVVLDKTYVVVTMVFLLNFPVPIADEYDDEDDASWHRATFRELIEAIGHFDFNFVEAEAAFVMPGTDQDALNELDLADEEWEHLVTLTH